MIIPAFNEERYLTNTVEHLRRAEQLLASRTGAAIEIVVVDNASTDGTALLARSLGVTVVHESEHNIGRVRNTGGRASNHEVLVFLDADTLVPDTLLFQIAEAMRGSATAGGAVDVRLYPKRRAVRVYLDFMCLIARVARMHMGACQFCRRDLFAATGGYDETAYIGEDVDFVWRLRVAARRQGLRMFFLRNVHVTTSSRRFDSWPLWRTLLMTNPFLVFALRHRRAPWRAWYDARFVPR